MEPAFRVDVMDRLDIDPVAKGERNPADEVPLEKRIALGPRELTKGWRQRLLRLFHRDAPIGARYDRGKTVSVVTFRSLCRVFPYIDSGSSRTIRRLETAILPRPLLVGAFCVSNTEDQTLEGTCPIAKHAATGTCG